MVDIMFEIFVSVLFGGLTLAFCGAVVAILVVLSKTVYDFFRLKEDEK